MFAKNMIRFLTSATVGLGVVTFGILAYASTYYKRSQTPTYERSQTPLKHYEFTQMTTLHPDWEYYDDNYINKKKKEGKKKEEESMRFDRDACPDNATFLGEEGLRLRAYRQNCVDCGNLFKRRFTVCMDRDRCEIAKSRQYCSFISVAFQT
ncbi:MAG: hypothetical protein GDA48_12005 [Hormoscilla sp. GM102CHS1]|nr:hypothetical protein [Hormoscilla sp. GM102CHS1]